MTPWRRAFQERASEISWGVECAERLVGKFAHDAATASGGEAALVKPPRANHGEFLGELVRNYGQKRVACGRGYQNLLRAR